MPDGVHSTTETTAVIAPGEDLARALAEPATAWPDVVLRPHQLEALDELAGRLQHGATRTWVDAPTGSGKTIMFLALAQALGGSALVLVPRRNLAEQTDAALARHFTAITANPEGPDAAGKPGVTVCTYQAALRHQDSMDWESVDLLICDEAHATLGAQTRKLLDRAKNAVVVGFTATGGDHHRSRGAGLRAGRRDARPDVGDRARHPVPPALAAGRAGPRPLRRRTRARRLRPGQPRSRPRPGALAPRLRRRVGGALPAPQAGRGGLHRDGRPGPRPGRGAHRARRARRGGLRPDARAGAAAGAVRLRLRADRRAVQRRPAHGGLGRDPRGRRDAPGARPPPSASSCSASGA